MRDSQTVFDSMMTPVYAGAAIALLLSVRQVDAWQKSRRHHQTQAALRKDGPVKTAAPATVKAALP